MPSDDEVKKGIEILKHGLEKQAPMIADILSRPTHPCYMFSDRSVCKLLRKCEGCEHDEGQSATSVNPGRTPASWKEK